jgi:hypothetical protein
MARKNLENAENLIRTYGEDIRARDIACYTNAVTALIIIFKQTHGKQLPHIWGVDFPETQDHHAYLVHQGIVYNQQITWPDDKYPDYNFEELVNVGKDVTSQGLMWMIDGIADLYPNGEETPLVLPAGFADWDDLLGSLIIACHVSQGMSLKEAVKQIQED